MAPIGFVHGWRTRIDDCIATYPEAAQLYREVMACLNRGERYDREIVDAVTQRWGQNRYDWYDAAAYVQVHTLVTTGHAALAFVDVGCEPARDRDRTANRRALREVEDGFVATFRGGVGDADGSLAWRGRIEVGQLLSDDSQLVVRYPPGGVPLEVGYTDPETTLWHLRREHGVARWPYGSTRITLLLAVTDRAVAQGSVHGVEVVRGPPIPPLEGGPRIGA